MKPKHIHLFRHFASGIALIAVGALPPHALAADATWNGSFSNSLTNGANWSSGSATFDDGNTATWNGTQAGDLFLPWNAGLGPSFGATQGLLLNITATNTGALQLDGVSGSLGLGNVTIASGAGAFTLGDGIGTATVTYRPTATPMTFANNSSNIATIKSDVVFGNGGGISNRNIVFAGTGNWLAEGAIVSSAAFGGSAAGASITKNDNGTLTLAGANGHGGGTTINGGVLAVTNGSALGTGGSVAVNGSFGTRLELSNNIALTGPTDLNLTGRSNSPDNTSSGASIRNVSGNNSISGNINFLNPGGTLVNILSTAGTLTLNGNLRNAIDWSATSRSFNIAGAGDTVVNGDITDGTLGTTGIAKNGTGTLTLNGSSSTYTAATTVSAGTLLVNGSIGNTAVSVASGATLGGTGSIAGSITVDASGTLSPGASIESLDVGSAVLNGKLLVEYDGAGVGTIDLLNVTGAFDITNGTVDFSGFGTATDDASYVFASYGSLIGSAFTSTLNLPSGYEINYAFGGNNIALVAIPEPAAALLGCVGLLGLLRRRRN